MHRIYFLNIPALHHAVFTHFTTTATNFFSWLEDQHDCAVEITCFSKILCGAQKHRCMAIMTASMHRTRNFGCPRKTCFFLNRQCIHICTKANNTRRCILPAFNDANNASPANTGYDFITTKASQFVSYELRSADSIKKDFRHFVQMPTPCCNLGLSLGKNISNRH